MRKKLLCMLLAMTGAVCAQAQFQKADISGNQPSLARGAHKTTIEPGANQVWWGYVGADDEIGGVGTSTAETYDCAVYIPSNNEIAAGKTINAIRFALMSKNVSNVKVWIAETTRPSNINTGTVRLVNVTQLDESGYNDVALPEPYTIADKNIYVGYSFTVTKLQAQADSYPVSIAGEEAPNMLWLRTSSSVTDWTDCYGYGFGRLYLQVLLGGDFSTQNGAKPASFGEVVLAPGMQSVAQMPVTNKGVNAITSIDYTVTANDVTSAEQHVDLATPVAFGDTKMVAVSIEAGEPGTVEQRTLTITKVNGVANEETEASAQFTACTVLHQTPRGIVVEEFTGTTCGWCPRGLVGMEKMRQKYGDAFVGIGVHRYTSSLSSDAMYISTYTQVSFGGAPSCRINRGDVIDPYYGSGNNVFDDFDAALAVPAKAALSLTADWNEDSTQVIANAEIEALVDGNFAIEYVLIADGLTGTTQPWRQYNYYHYAYGQFSDPSQLPEDLGFLVNTGQIFNNQYVAYYPIFNDVAIAVAKQTQTQSIGQLNMGQMVENSYTLSLPTASAQKELINALNNTGKGNIAAVALLIDKNTNTIANAAKFYLPVYDPTTVGIATTNVEDNAEVARFAADGRQLQAPQKGLNIVRMADGRTVKVIVR